MKNKLIIATIAMMAVSLTISYATCTGKSKTESGLSNDSCGHSGSYDGMSCTYECCSPTYDVCDTSNTSDTKQICNTGPESLSGITKYTYGGANAKCSGGTCNNGEAQGDGTLLTPQPKVIHLVDCAG